MWELLTKVFMRLWGRGGNGQERRADFAAVTKQWERLAMQTETQLSHCRTRLDDLETMFSKVQTEHIQCMEDRRTQSAELLQLEARLATIEAKPPPPEN